MGANGFHRSSFLSKVWIFFLNPKLLDMYDRVFQPNQQYGMVSRVWGNSYDNGTFWTSDIAASYGIEMYPIHGGSLYLGQDSAYVADIWAEIEQYTGILTNEANPNLWHDVKWKYLAFVDPAQAIAMYDSYPERDLKFGVSDAQTYYWLHAMNVLGRVDATLTADHPLAAAFRLDGETTYVAQNYGDSPIVVTFSDGFSLPVPPRQLVTSKDIDLSGALTSSFPAAYPGGSVELVATVDGGTPTKVAFYDGETLLGEVTQAPSTLTAANLTVGRHGFYARLYDGTDFSLTNFVEVLVGEQRSYFGTPKALPGSFQVAEYDFFEGGKGQEIAYRDLSLGNNGDFRPEEDVDAETDVNEGTTVGWIAGGEWLEYTVDVQQPGLYRMEMRYASGNQAGGGPFWWEQDGQPLHSPAPVTYTGDWDAWSTRTINDIPLKGGEQVLRLHFGAGELNVGQVTFTQTAQLPYDQPVADAGENVLVLLPADTAGLDGSNSSDPGSAPLTFKWEQRYGPSVLGFSDAQAAQPQVSGLVEGVYLLRLTVDNGSYTDTDEMYLISSGSPNVAPTVSLISPRDQAVSLVGDPIELSAYATDLIGSVAYVDFFAGADLLGTDSTAPYTLTWVPEVGTYDLTAVAVDDEGATGTSQVVQVTIDPAPPCTGTSFDGDFSWEFSPDDNNPTLTFIPSIQGMGSPTCILYYGTNPSALPGYNVTPNVPFQLNASEGTLIYFYYTYSYPGQGEKNNSAHKDTYQIGTCQSTTGLTAAAPLDIRFYPNPVTHSLTLELPTGKSSVQVWSATGQHLDQFEEWGPRATYDMRHLPAGLYLLEVQHAGRRAILKVVK